MQSNLIGKTYGDLWTVNYSHKGYGFNDAEAYVERGDVYKDIYKKLGVENASSWTFDKIYESL